MQLNNKALLYTTTTNEFSELTPTYAGELKCAVLTERKSKDSGNSSRKFDYDIVVITTNRAYSPYSLILVDDSITLTLDGKKYSVAKIDTIRDFSGKSKYFEIYLVEIKT